MFFGKQQREIDRIIEGDARPTMPTDDRAIDVKIKSREQLFSAYSYSDDMLNAEFGEYIFDKAKAVPIKEPVKIRIHTDENIQPADVGQALKNHYRAAYKQGKKDVKRVVIISILMTLFGVLALTALFLINRFFDNPYLTSIVEIAAWVFIWEAVDFFFLQRPVLKGKCLLIQRIYMAEIEICPFNAAETEHNAVTAETDPQGADNASAQIDGPTA